MIQVLWWVVVVPMAALLAPSLVFCVECLLGALARRGGRAAGDGPRPATAVLVPAHDEEEVIEGTLRGLVAEIGEGDRILVVADNCSDRTAEVARRLAVEVVERRDPDRRGKGHALLFGLDHIAKDPPEVVVVVDADCALSPESLEALSRAARDSGRPAQAEYLLTAPERPTPRTAVSALAFLVRNKVRPLGLSTLGLPCHLTGSGMAFPWEVIRAAPPTGSHLVEDLLMGIELSLLGHMPALCREAHVRSELPASGDAAMSQRRRWEHGQLTTLLTQAPRLLVAGLTRASAGLLALGLDLVVPPLSLLVVLLLLAAAAGGAALALGLGPVPLSLATTALSAVALGVGAAWLRFGRETLPPRQLLAVPLYLLWKIPIYVSLLVRGRQRSWVRTDRSGGGK